MSELKGRRFHIIVDAYNCNEQILDDKQNLEEAIREIAKLCDMSILYGPVIIQGEPYNPGLTGFTIIDFSHISIHTFTKEKEMCVDVFSCKKYDNEQVKNYVVEKFKLDKKFVKYIEVKYPEKQTSN